MKQQLIVIHGGDTFDSYEEYLESLKSFELDFERSKVKKWKKTLSEKLGNDFDVISPEMPNELNAKYLEWRIWFEKYIPHLNDGVILLGHSLGAIFIAKFLSENVLLKKIHATLLVAPPFDDIGHDYSLSDFTLPEDMSKFEQQAGKITIYHSKDDSVVPYADAKKYKKKIPSIELKTFSDQGHFSQEKFPEIIKDIQALFTAVTS